MTLEAIGYESQGARTAMLIMERAAREDGWSDLTWIPSNEGSSNESHKLYGRRAAGDVE